MTMTIYHEDGSYRTIENVDHILQYSRKCSNGLDVKVITYEYEGYLQVTEDIHLNENEFYSIDSQG